MRQLRAGIDRAITRIRTLRAGPLVRYGAPVLLAVAAIVAAELSRSILPGGGVFLILLLPVLLSSLVLGVGSGAVALLLGAIGAWLLVPITGHPWLSDTAHLARFGLYAGEGALILALAFALRRTAQRAHGPAILTLPPTQSLEPPTAREREVLALAASGLSTRAIGERLFLSENTIKSHLARIYGKLGARNRAEAVSAGLQAGWITADSSPSEPVARR
jgi:DNA-binding CsgD family transcriptional regulator